MFIMSSYLIQTCSFSLSLPFSVINELNSKFCLCIKYRKIKLKANFIYSSGPESNFTMRRKLQRKGRQFR